MPVKTYTRFWVATPSLEIESPPRPKKNSIELYSNLKLQGVEESEILYIDLCTMWLEPQTVENPFRAEKYTHFGLTITLTDKGMEQFYANMDKIILQEKENDMPLTAKGKKVHAAMVKQYGSKKADKVFYAMVNEGKLTGAEGKKRKKKKK